MATEKQLEYIEILSSYESSKERDKKLISEFLKDRQVTDLSVKEASELIQKLLEIKVMHCFPCGRDVLLSKREVNSGRILGEFEMCCHHCHLEGGLNDCVYYQWDYPKEITNSKKLLKRCICCKKISEYTIRHHIDYKFNVVVPVCPACHRIIHNDRDPRYNYLKPIDRRLRGCFFKSKNNVF